LAVGTCALITQSVRTAKGFGLDASRTPTLTGVVLDPEGRPAAGASVSVQPRFGLNNSSVVTDSNGSFGLLWEPVRLGGSERVCSLIARDTLRDLAVAQDFDEPGKVDLRLAPALTITGRVEDEKGKALAGGDVFVLFWSGNMAGTLDEHPVKVDAQGRFEIHTLPADRRYLVQVRTKGYGMASKDVTGSEAVSNRIELPDMVLKTASMKLRGRVVDESGSPVARANVFISGDGQPGESALTDGEGCFAFDVCEGRIRLSVSAQNLYVTTSAEAGDTNLTVVLQDTRRGTVREAPEQQLSLKGKPLPDLADLGISADAIPAGKRVLLCLFDLEQRPSRRVVRLLAEQQDALKQKDIVVLAVQAAVASNEAMNEWKTSNPTPFPVGRLTSKSDKTRWVSNVKSLPWLILTDTRGRVVAEGFALDNLDAMLKQSP
jgi:protocatechuate 3,4-dioxygenase beta subunit